MASEKGIDSTLRIRTPVQPSEVIRLQVVSGPDNGKHCPVPAAMKSIGIGTRPDCELVLTDPTVSRRHAEILREEGRFRLHDRGSTNGTFVDNVRVQEAYVEPDSVIRVGRTEIRLMASDVAEPSGFEGIYGHSRLMQQVFVLIQKVAASPLTVLITGQTGTGKELAARAIHRRSSRSAGPFHVVDCSAIPENLMESELFGHERGAFTGANVSRKGAFELAHGGTIFLDEIGELSPQLQPKLLRVLERQDIKRLGSSQPVQVDVRVIAATNRDLKREIQEGRFREDLFYRLSVLELPMPALADREGDIRLLATHFVQQSVSGNGRTLSEDAMKLLELCSWPGNVRQLRNVIERALLQSNDPEIGANDVAALLPVSATPAAKKAEVSLQQMERKAIEEVLRLTKGNKSEAARRLGIAYSTLYEKIKKYGL